MPEVSQLLNAIDQGDPQAAAQLLPLVYDELRRLAAARLAAKPSGNTLQPTALVHEAYLRLVGAPGGNQWDHRGHFFAACAEAMRRILIDDARRKGRAKHAGGRQRVDLDLCSVSLDMPADHLLALDEALTRLAEYDAQAARLVDLHCFAGLSIEQAAETIGISPRTAYRDWSFAQAWLYREIHGTEPPPEK